MLKKTERDEIGKFLNETVPSDHGYTAEFWSTVILSDLIQRKYGVLYKSKKPFYILFQEAQFSFHKPGQVYEKRSKEKVVTWKKASAPKLQEAFQDQNTVILCEDAIVLNGRCQIL
ncbi:winged helix-turn-helix domain-containing protein [bacterium]|nr:MAG: winged helix-turn-helix domain-containing protein [bacterium]QQR61453.1 MAG: winged helix-turn-helix domain-containing protein [bacterium]QQR63021.1 MAG: winged helix-turn-helix domain-containing protein [bacterium]